MPGHPARRIAMRRMAASMGLQARRGFGGGGGGGGQQFGKRRGMGCQLGRRRARAVAADSSDSVRALSALGRVEAAASADRHCGRVGPLDPSM
jgi:hypothetical protein